MIEIYSMLIDLLKIGSLYEDSEIAREYLRGLDYEDYMIDKIIK